LRPEGPYPILALTGPKGSGKTTAALLLRSLIDPAQHPLEGHPHWVIAFEDVKTIPAALDHDNHPVILVLQESPDSTLTPELAARTLVVEMPAIPEIKRRNIADLWQVLKNIRPRVLSSLLTSVSIALGNRKQPGFADLKDWLLAAEPAIRLSELEIEAILKPRPMPQDLVASAISGLMTDVESWSGTATRLLKVLQDIDATGTGWPQTARTISKSLNLAGILLRRRGIAMIFGPNAEITVTRRAGC
jgi:molybdopterin-guanine dinucleotide biosynthesis protein